MSQTRKKVKVAVIGAGISGLSSAYRILTKYSDIVDLCVITEFDLDDTTSIVAAGLWRPDEHFSADEDAIQQMKQWFLATRIYYESLVEKGLDAQRGLSTNFLLKLEVDRNRSNDCFQDIVPFEILLSVEETQRLYPHAKIPSKVEFASLTHAFICRPRIYLPWMKEEIVKMGGTFQVGTRVHAFEELKDFDVVVNCSAMSAKTLASDDKMVPIRGQVTLVEAPWISTGMHCDFSSYILPGMDGTVTLGGCYQKGNDSYEVDYELKETYLSKCYEFAPSLRSARLIKDMVGLRPLRVGGPRVELEMVVVGLKSDRKLPVIHNYGHGPEGWGLHWGTSGTVLELFAQWMQEFPIK